MQTFIACDPELEGDTQKMRCHLKEQVYLHISKFSSLHVDLNLATIEIGDRLRSVCSNQINRTKYVW